MSLLVTLTYDPPSANQTILEGTYTTSDGDSGTWSSPILRFEDQSFDEEETIARVEDTIRISAE